MDALEWPAAGRGRPAIIRPCSGDESFFYPPIVHFRVAAKIRAQFHRGGAVMAGIAFPSLVTGAAHISHIERTAEVLRLAGRLEFLGARWIKTLIFPDRDVKTMRRALAALYEQRLIWRVPVPIDAIPGAIRARNGQPPVAKPFVYGLTPEGRTWLAEQGAEESSVLEGMPVRPWDNPDVRPAQLKHDLLVSDWVVSLLDGARRCPLLAGVVAQAEYISYMNEAGQAVQRFDALVMLAFDAALGHQQRRPGWAIPWASGPLRDAGTQRVVRLAGEIDRGTEKLATLLGKAGTYRALTLSGHYERTLGGPALAVVLAPPGRRAGQIAREWIDGWPGGKGVVSNFMKAQHPRYGALWGEYYTMTDTLPRQVSLLDAVGLPLTMWEQLIANWAPGRPSA